MSAAPDPTDGHVIEAHVVDDESPGEPERVEVVKASDAADRPATAMGEAASAAIVAASEAAMVMPGIPGRDEFLSLAMQARMLSMSGAAPKAVRDNPHVAFHVAMVGRDLGLSPSAALELIDVIDGQRGPQISLSPQLLNGQIRRLGLGSIVPLVREVAGCVVMAMGPGGFYDERCKPRHPDHVDGCRCTFEQFLGTSEFTWEDAREAMLVGDECTTPGQHSVKCLNSNSSANHRCNFGYRTYAKRMLWWRASGFATDDYFPEASLGMYTPEALGAMVDSEGRPLDPANVDLPPGYEPAALPPGRRQAAGAGKPPAADPTLPPAEADVLDDLAVRIAALPDAQRDEYRRRWKESRRLAPYGLTNLPADRLTLATSMLVGFESIATREGWDADTAREAVLAARGEESPGDLDEPDDGGTPAPDDPDTPPSDAPQAAEGAGAPDAAPEPDGDADEAHSPQPDPVVAEWVRGVAGAHDPAEVEQVAVEVKALHHGTVNTQLRARGFEPAGEHIDTRRMVLTACRLDEAAHPEWCIILGCENDAVPDEREPERHNCTDHTPF